MFLTRLVKLIVLETLVFLLSFFFFLDNKVFIALSPVFDLLSFDLILLSRIEKTFMLASRQTDKLDVIRTIETRNKREREWALENFVRKTMSMTLIFCNWKENWFLKLFTRVLVKSLIRSLKSYFELPNRFKKALVPSLLPLDHSLNNPIEFQNHFLFILSIVSSVPFQTMNWKLIEDLMVNSHIFSTTCTALFCWLIS